MSRFLDRRFAALDEYTPGEQPQDRRYIKLNTNESPYPPSPRVLEAVDRAAVADLRLYPDPDTRALRAAIAASLGAEPENIYTGNGSDDILNFTFMAFCGAGKGAAFPDISYGFYEVYCALYGIDCLRVPLRSDFTIAPEDYGGCSGIYDYARGGGELPGGIALVRGGVPCPGGPAEIQGSGNLRRR